MTARASQDARGGISPAFAGSVLLHAAVAAALLISWPWLSKPIPLGSVVPVTIVTQGPPDVRPAEQAPQEQTAQTEDPVPEAPPEPAPPPPAPAPAPPPPTPKAPPAKTPPPKAPPTPTPKAEPREQNFDFDALQKSIARSRSRNPSPPRPAAAPRGPSREETAVQARPAVGAATGLTASALGALAAELQRRWNPNCEVEGGSDINIRVAFRLGVGGALMERPVAQTPPGSAATVVAAADRAVRAVNQAAPFENLPPELSGQRVVVNFNAKQACSQR